MSDFTKECHGRYSAFSVASRGCIHCDDSLTCIPVSRDDGIAGFHPDNAFANQVGGSHYKDMAIQPAEYCHFNRIGKLEGDVIAYVSRWRAKNGVEDLRKARHTLDLMIEMETRE